MQGVELVRIEQEEGKEVSRVSIISYLRECGHNWIWFLLSVIVCCSIAVLYVKSRTQLYSTYAYVLIKSDIQPGTNSANSIFSELGVNSNSSILENEIFVFKSSMLHEQVVQKLSLASQYYIKSALRKINIYKNSPIAVTSLSKLEGSIDLEIMPLDNDKFRYLVTSFDEAKWAEAEYGVKLSVPIGLGEEENILYTDITVTRTEKLSQSWYGTKVYVNVANEHARALAFAAALNGDYADIKAYVLALSITGENPQMISDLINTLIEVYNQNTINDKNQVAIKTEEFIVARVAALYNDLDNIDSEIENLKIESKSPDVTSMATTSSFLNEGSKANDALATTEVELQLANYIKDYMSSMDDFELIPANTGISDMGLEKQISLYNEECLNYSKVSSVSAVDNPIITELQKSLKIMHENISRSINSYINTLEIKLQQAKKQKHDTEQAITSVPTQEKKINNVTRQQKIKEQLYLYLLNKREENALQMALSEPTAKVIEYAERNPIPIYPTPSLTLALGLFLGLLIPAIVIYLILFITALDTKIHTRQDVEDSCGLPIVGEIPVKNKEQQSEEILAKENGRDQINEALRIIRSNLNYMIKKDHEGGTIIQTTSTIPGEGKSFISINLAISCSHVNKRVVLVDLDLRKGNLSKYLNLDSKKLGLSAFLSGRVDNIKDITISGSIHPNLDIIPAGIIPPNPTDLLISEYFKKFVETLRANYDIIFFDTVPYNVVADAGIINSSADLTLYIIRNGIVDKKYLKTLEKISNDNKLRNLAIILTYAKVYTKRNSAGYGYGYGYGYDDDENGKSRK